MGVDGSGRWPGNGLNRRSVAVPEAANRLNRCRARCVGVELSPQVADVELHLVAGGGEGVAPDDVRIWTAGLNWWINKTATNLKLEFQHMRRGLLSAPNGTPTPGNQNQKIVFTQGMIQTDGNGFNELNAPYDAKVIGDYTGLTPPFGFGH